MKMIQNRTYKKHPPKTGTDEFQGKGAINLHFFYSITVKSRGQLFLFCCDQSRDTIKTHKHIPHIEYSVQKQRVMQQHIDR